MADRASEGINRVAVLANRLRLVQLDFADDDQEARQQYMAEEIERELSQLHPDERQDFLAELREAFPSWDAQVAVPAPATEVVAPTQTDQRELQDPSFLVSRLIELAPTFSGAEREQIIGRLREAGLSPVSQQDWPEEAAAELREELKLADNIALEPARVVELASMMTRLGLSLDRVVWQAWKTIAPRSAVRGPKMSLPQALVKFVQGDQRVAHAHVAADVNQLRMVIAALVSAIGQFALRYSQDYVDMHSPGQVERNSIGIKGFVSKEVKCWRQYELLMTGRDQRSVEREIMELLGKAAEDLMGAMPSGRPGRNG